MGLAMDSNPNPDPQDGTARVRVDKIRDKR